MILPFRKYHGTGNDFILIDNRVPGWSPATKQVAFLCDRHLGIGADGLMLLSEQPGYDFGMRYFNSDGNESSMCGNGGRCITFFAQSLGLIRDSARFHAIDGEHLAEITGTDQQTTVVRLKMTDTVIGQEYREGVFLDTGSPHLVVFVPDVEAIDVFHDGGLLREDQRFAPGGTNVDFVQKGKDHIFVRTYERGVENETLSCGTGVTASALATAFRYPGNPGYCQIKTRGGALKVSFLQHGASFSNIWLEGEATYVFSGKVELTGI